MRAGTLRHRLTIQTPVVNRDADGGQHLAWLAVATVWGAVTPLSLAASTEQLIAGQVAARLSHTITLRYRAALLPTAQLVLQPSGRVFEVVSVLDTDERHRELTVMALERV